MLQMDCCHPSDPTSKDRQVPEFLSAAGYCCLWIPEFVAIARPLYTSTKRGTEPLTWTETERKAFEALKTSLTSAAALKLPDARKTKDITKGVLTHTLGPRKLVRMTGPWNHRMVHLSKNCGGYC